MYEIGDVVRVASDLRVQFYRGIVGEMVRYAGEYMTIKSVHRQDSFATYELKEDHWGFTWADWMFEHTEEIPLEISCEDMEGLL